MQRRFFAAASILLATIAVVACVTINVYFPEAAVKDLSEKIEDAVAREAAEAVEGDMEPQGEVDAG